MARGKSNGHVTDDVVQYNTIFVYWGLTERKLTLKG